jgi:Myb/SANT-like DNA-binding domain
MLDLGKWFSSSFQWPSLYQPQFKEEYKIVKTLWSLSGFGWDDSKKMVTAEPQVWDAYLKVSVYYTIF